MFYVLDHFDCNNIEILGSDGVRIAKDLKTENGLRSRIKRQRNTFNERAVYIKAYKTPDIYNRQRYQLCFAMYL